MIALILLILAFACFVVGAANFPIARINIVALGLAFWVAAQFASGVNAP